MEIVEDKTSQCVIIGITGRLDTTNYTLLENKLMELIDNQQDKILVECSKMDYISSSGLRILLMALAMRLDRTWSMRSGSTKRARS